MPCLQHQGINGTILYWSPAQERMMEILLGWTAMLQVSNADWRGPKPSSIKLIIWDGSDGCDHILKSGNYN